MSLCLSVGRTGLGSDLDVASTTTPSFSGCCPVVCVANDLSYDLPRILFSFFRSLKAPLRASRWSVSPPTAPAITYLKPFVPDSTIYHPTFLPSRRSRLHELQVFPCPTTSHSLRSLSRVLVPSTPCSHPKLRNPRPPSSIIPDLEPRIVASFWYVSHYLSH